MNDDYMNIFTDMFFDINTNDDVKNILAQASELFSTLIYKLGEVSNELNYKRKQFNINLKNNFWNLKEFMYYNER